MTQSQHKRPIEVIDHTPLTIPIPAPLTTDQKVGMGLMSVIMFILNIVVFFVVGFWALITLLMFATGTTGWGVMVPLAIVLGGMFVYYKWMRTTPLTEEEEQCAELLGKYLSEEVDSGNATLVVTQEFSWTGLFLGSIILGPLMSAGSAIWLAALISSGIGVLALGAGATVAAIALTIVWLVLEHKWYRSHPE